MHDRNKWSDRLFYILFIEFNVFICLFRRLVETDNGAVSPNKNISIVKHLHKNETGPIRTVKCSVFV